MKRQFNSYPFQRILIVFFIIICCFSHNLVNSQTTVTPIDGATTNSNNGVIYGWASEPNRYSLYQHIYKQTLINQSGTITHIQFENQIIGTFTNVAIYLGETIKSSFTSSSDWVNSGLTLVYSGVVTTGNGWYQIALNTPFNYTNTNNLIVAIYQNGGTTPNSSNARHIIGTSDANVTIRNYGTSSYGSYPNWNGGFGTRVNELPSLKLTFAPSCTATILSTSSAESCGSGILSLNATANTGSTVQWYDQQTGGQLLSSANSYTTPSLSQTTTYWVEAFNSIENCSSPRFAVVATINNVPQQPITACYETATFNNSTCQWEITGSQPPQPSLVNCWDNFVFDNINCLWQNIGSQPQQPATACYETATFNSNTCIWDITGTQPPQPTNLACYETAAFNSSICQWEVSGSQPQQPPMVNCWDNFVFNSATCSWDNTGSQDPQPQVVNCWDNFVFDILTCQWNNIGTQPLPPATACYEIAIFNTNSCGWDIDTTLSNSVSQNGNTLTAQQQNVNYLWIDCATSLAIPNENNQTFTPTTTGSYAVQLTEITTNCVLQSLCFDVTILGLESISGDEIRLVPNPANGFVKIEGAKIGDQISFLSPTGQVIFSKRITTEELVDLQHWKPSIYFVKVTSESGEVTLKLIVQ